MNRKILPAVILILVSSIVFFVRLGDVGLFDVDEAVFAEATREMVQTGDWITPHYNGENRYDKPILFYWIMGISYGIFGANEWGARLPSAFAGLALLFLVYRGVGWALGSELDGFLSALTLATSLEIVYLGRAAVTDMALVLFICASVFGFFRASREEGSGKRRWYWIGWSAAALAVLTKGPIGVLLPGLALIPFLWSTGGLRREIRAPGFWSGLALFVLIVAPWYGVEVAVTGGDFFRAFFLKHNLHRYLGEISGHGGPVYLFILVTLVGFYPWSSFLPGAWWRAIPRTRRELKEWGRERQFLYLCALWFAGGLLFFSFSGTKLPNYIAPMFPAAAALVGGLWGEHCRGERESDRWRKIHWSLVAGLALTLALGFFLMPYGVHLLEARAEHNLFLKEVLTSPPRLGGLPYWAGGILLAGAAAAIGLRLRPVPSFAALAAGMLAFFLLVVVSFLPLADFYVQRPLRQLSREAGRDLGGGGTLAVLDANNRPSIVFYSRHFIDKLQSAAEARELLQSGKRVLLLTKVTRLHRLQSDGIGKVLQREGGYALVAPGKPLQRD